MSSARRFRINAPSVVHETIEDEAVIVNLSNGVYYSVERAGADIWALVEQRLPVSHIASAVAQCYAGTREAIETGVDQFLAQLHEENLIVPDDGAAATEPPNPAPVAPGGERPPFVAPVLQSYTDMEDLLLLDPVHDLDEQDGLSEAAAGA